MSMKHRTPAANYRREIDGLRALAVLAVVGHHANFPFFAGGFVGVDVFFVISGYLITAQIQQQLDEGRFSLLTFYERRARRLLPALFFVALVTSVLSLLLLYPSELETFATSLTYTALYLSNVFFARTTTYFDTTAHLQPLLHTWSLAVEEQFYLAFPLLLLGLRRVRERPRFVVLAIVASLSLIGAHWAASHIPTINYYSLPSRLWELLFGGLLALAAAGVTDTSNKRAHQEWLSVIGLLLIAIAVVAFDKYVPFPSFYTLLPVVGTCLVLAYAAPSTRVGGFLGGKTLVVIGLMSYSIYLWHQPIFAFVRRGTFEAPSSLAMLGVTFAVFAIAYLSWRFVEQPLRYIPVSRRTTLTVAALATLSLAGLGWLLPLALPSDALDEEQQQIESFLGQGAARIAIENQCLIDSGTQTFYDLPQSCVTSFSRNAVLVWGDSHAAALASGMREARTSVWQTTATRCPPVLNVDFLGAKHCAGINRGIFNAIEKLRPDRLVLHANWHSYGKRVATVGDTIDAIKRVSPRTQIVLVGNVPLWSNRLPRLMLQHNLPAKPSTSLKLPLYDALQTQDRRLREIALERGVTFVSALDVFCTRDRCAVSVRDDEPLSFDYGHLTPGAAAALAARISNREK
jgi:peptidoglycan/LPS O-acetylase OafA/YrhL